MDGLRVDYEYLLLWNEEFQRWDEDKQEWKVK